MISVRAPSRLHFGLLSFPSGPYWPNQVGEESLPARRFGSVGLMIQDPGVSLKISPADHWSAEGPLADRALLFARRLAVRLPQDPEEPSRSPQHIIVENCAAEHVGLGTGTQLALAVGRALQEAWAWQLNRQELTRRLDRGARSALGVHGFFEGGFLVEAGKLSRESLSPLVAHVPFPESWRIVLAIPPGRPGLHGIEESEAFQRLRGISLEKTDTLCRLVLLGMLPVLAEQDWKTFGEALHDFNALAGESFAKVQGGTYGSNAVAELVDFIRLEGIAGVGQSSWGPAVFAITADPDQANGLVQRIQARFALEPSRVFTTSASNQGAVIDSR